MRGFGILIFILLLPAFGALGHDIYVTYKEQDFTKPMMFSDVGYLWTNYEPDTYEWAKTNVDQGTWDSILTPFLEQTSVIVAAIPALLLMSVLLLLRLLHLPPFSDTVKVKKGHKQGGFSFGSGENKKGKMSYKRK